MRERSLHRPAGSEEGRGRAPRSKAGASAQSPVTQEQLADAVAALQSTLQEVELAERELAQQNEELIAVREALEIERHRYRELFELAPDGYVISNAEGVIEEANHAAGVMLNTTTSALRRKPLAVFIAQEGRSRFRSLLQDVREGQEARDFEALLQPRDAEPRSALLTVVRDAEQGERPARLRWMLRDISERKAAEEALRASEERLRHAQRLESIGRLAGGIAHSFNNLLAAIGFHADLVLEHRGLDEPLRHHAEAIRKAGERAAALARQLLAFSRKQVLQPERLRAGAAIAGLEPMLRRLIGEHIVLETALVPAAGTVLADLGQFEQVVLNLVVNARDAMPQGGRLLIAAMDAELGGPEESGLELPPGPYVKVTVTDSGTGMSPEVRGRLFEPFFTTKPPGKGTGLGLATVYGIVRQSGGDVRVESTPGKGSSFHVYLPQLAEQGEPREACPQAGAPVRGSEVVLLVEDEDNIREPAAEILESRGYTVLAARDGAEAREIARHRAGPIHLMITDVIMPGMNGSKLAEELRPLRPEMRVLYISGYPEDAIAQHGVLDPGKAFLQKPCPATLLLRTVRDLLDAKAGAPRR